MAELRRRPLRAQSRHCPDGKVWFNGHFTRDPEILGSVDPATGKVTKQNVPAHPTLAAGPGGPIPYELRVARDGRVWMSELQGNRLIAFTPGTGKFQVFTLPTPLSGPRRFDLDRNGIVRSRTRPIGSCAWIPPADASMRSSCRFLTRCPTSCGPIQGRPARIGTSAADALLRYRPATRRFDVTRCRATARS